MDAYPIHELERLTGIKAHTIRIWEKRYGLIEPMRTDTNRRRYSEQQVRKLLNVSTLLSRGMRISRIATLSEEEINNCILSGSNDDLANTISNGYINDLVRSMLALDEGGFERVTAAAFLRYGFYEGMLQVIYPFLKQAGLLWCAAEAVPAHEHFACNIIRRKLLSAIDGLLPPDPKLPTFLMFLPEGEWHEIGLLFASYVVRVKGCGVLYLGQNIGVPLVKAVLDVKRPDYVLSFYISGRSEQELIEDMTTLCQGLEETTVLVTGNRKLSFAAGRLPESVEWLQDWDDLFQFLPK